MRGRWRQQTAYVNYQGRWKLSKCWHRTCSANKHCWCQGKQGRFSHWYPQHVHSDACQREKEYGNHQAKRILYVYPVQIVLDYNTYVTRDKRGVKQLLLLCQNALYGTMVASLLYYCKFAKSLTNIGFEIKLYDPCVANKVIEWSQLTILFHIDYCKMS